MINIKIDQQKAEEYCKIKHAFGIKEGEKLPEWFLPIKKYYWSTKEINFLKILNLIDRVHDEKSVDT